MEINNIDTELYKKIELKNNNNKTAGNNERQDFFNHFTQNNDFVQLCMLFTLSQLIAPPIPSSSCFSEPPININIYNYSNSNLDANANKGTCKCEKN